MKLKVTVEHTWSGSRQEFVGDADTIVAALVHAYPWLTRRGPVSGGSLLELVEALDAGQAFFASIEPTE